MAEKRRPKDTDPETKTATKPEKWKPPRGIRLFYRADRKNKPWCVQWREPSTKAKRLKSFASEKSQIRYAKDIAGKNLIEKNRLLNVDPKKWFRFLQFEERIGGIENLDQIEAMLRRQKQAWGYGSTEKIGHKFIDAKERQGVDDQQLRRYKVLLEGLETSFPDSAINDLTPEWIRTWIDRKRLPNGKPVSPVTKNNHRKMLHAFFEYCRRHQYLSENPIEFVDRWGTEEKPAGILTVEQGRALFEVNRDQPCIGRLALEAFAGLRYTSARDISADDIKMEDKGILLLPKNNKTRKRFYVDGFPANLWKWLEATPPECWEIKPRQYLEEKKKAFLRANITPPHNCLRHSFATYHLAAFRDAGLTATLLCHNSLAMLNRHYRGNATHREGKEWFEVLP